MVFAEALLAVEKKRLERLPNAILRAGAESLVGIGDLPLKDVSKRPGSHRPL